MSWFADWFNSPYYHTLYRSRNEQESKFFIDNLGTKLDFNSSHQTLDLACGKGRHSIYLNSKGLDVLGVDLAPESIAEASRHENDKLKFLVHDMRSEFGADRFDIILNLFTSFGYFEDPQDDLRMLKSVYQSLKPNGTLLIDFLNATKVIANLVPYEEKVIDGITFKITKKVENRWIFKTIAFEDQGKEFLFQEKVKAFELADFQLLFDQIGFALTAVYGNYSLDHYNASSSERLILVAKKA